MLQNVGLEPFESLAPMSPAFTGLRAGHGNFQLATDDDPAKFPEDKRGTVSQVQVGLREVPIENGVAACIMHFFQKQQARAKVRAEETASAAPS